MDPRYGYPYKGFRDRFRLMGPPIGLQDQGANNAGCVSGLWTYFRVHIYNESLFGIGGFGSPQPSRTHRRLPRRRRSFFASRRGNGTLCATIPICARRTRPCRMISLTTKTAVLLAMAKQIPCALLIIAVLMPTTSPVVATSGPPELPGLSAASV